MRSRVALLVALPCAVIAIAAVSVRDDLQTPRDRHGAAFAGSDACARCHPDHHASWARTFHRTMTREASDETVLGDFSGAELEYLGITARMDRGPGGGFRMTFTRADGTIIERVRVARTVGSHRYQQYLARVGDKYVRLPIAWHVEDRRWFHMNGAFLTPDPREPVTRRDYERHVVTWNDNCVFCHNVGPKPGLDAARHTFRTEVAELGVACEACHGPAAEHVRVNTSPARRYALHLARAADPTITSPARLSPERSADVCGRCHGQRITDDVERFLRRGDPFVPGDDLALYSAPLWRDTTLHGDEAFRERFWADGTARLTAYEYQGLLQSACAARGALTCTSCHGMHEGDPRGQIRPASRGNAACTTCHEELATARALRSHAKHDPSGPGAECVSCHMPRVVYGLVDVHRSHRIEIPDPARAAALGRPDACTLCHADETRAWSVRAAHALWPRVASGAPADVEASMPEAQRAALAGDPIERAVAARALGDLGAAPSASDRAKRIGVLLDVMANDAYPGVRAVAWRAARRIAAPAARAALARYVPEARATDRARAIATATSALGPDAVAPPDRARAPALRAQARSVAIEIGE